MEQYSALARVYDRLMTDAPYSEYVQLLDRTANEMSPKANLILDYGCGTGTLSMALAQKGYSVIGSDESEDMLAVAYEKCSLLENRPIFLHQNMLELDLYGTVDMVFSAIDSINYLLDRKDLVSAFKKVHLFLNPGGVFLFDINSREKLLNMSGNAYLKETEDVYCVFCGLYDHEKNICQVDYDLFLRDKDNSWKLFRETHFERAYTLDEIKESLQEAGFAVETVFTSMSDGLFEPGADRVFFKALKKC